MSGEVSWRASVASHLLRVELGKVAFKNRRDAFIMVSADRFSPVSINLAVVWGNINKQVETT